MDSSHAFTEMTVQYLLELEWTARWIELLIMQTTMLTARTVLSNLNRRLSLPQLPVV